jgi:rubrerythrin
MIPKSELLTQAMDALESGEDDIGICRVCGNEQGGTEPDAERYACENCGAQQVFGAEQLLVRLGG